jgi:hypothetical protein
MRILISLIGGWTIAAILLVFVRYFDNDNLTAVLLWHWGPIYSLAGNGPLLGYRPDGTPLYEGTPIHLVFGLIGYLAGFLIYPIIIYLVWSAIAKYGANNH